MADATVLLGIIAAVACLYAEYETRWGMFGMAGFLFAALTIGEIWHG